MSVKDRNTISQNTRVELGIVVMLVTAMVSAIVAGSVWCTRITMGQTRLAEELEELTLVVERSTHDRWTRSDMNAWIDRANREAEVWTLETEHRLNLEDGHLLQFTFPSTD